MADAGRVVAGRARGIRLLAPGPGTRPLGDRVKQSLFGTLEPRLRGARVLDLYAGSGAAGIEALSRGAAEATFVERDRDAARIVAENLRRTGLEGAGATVVRAEVLAWLRRGPAAAGLPPLDVVVLDPPYDAAGAVEATLAALGDPGAGWLARGAVVVAKHFWRDAPAAHPGLLASTGTRRFGETALTFYRVEGPDDAGPALRPEEEA